jgi:hypothetical protein
LNLLCYNICVCYSVNVVVGYRATNSRIQVGPKWADDYIKI